MFTFIVKAIMKSNKHKKVIDYIIKTFLLQNVTYSHNCEDIIVNRFFEKDKGIYVDVGAHHPYKYSNTYQLFLRGWSGINIDPLPNCMAEFKKYRPNDINLNIGVAEESSVIQYYCFTEPAYNTISKTRADELIEKGISSLKAVRDINVLPLKAIFDKYLVCNEIDFLNIDVETMEMSVLKSNDWTRYRPKLIAIESIISYSQSLDRLGEDESIRFLEEKNYIPIAKFGNAVFLMSND